MNHSSYIDFFREAAKHSTDLKHEQDWEPGDSRKRKAFFRSDAEVESAITDGLSDGPFMVVGDYRGRLVFGSMVADAMTAGFEIRKIVSGEKDYDGREAAESACKDVALKIVQLMNDEFEEYGHAGRMPGFDMNTVAYSFIEPVLNKQYGVLVMFQLQDEGLNPYTYNRDTDFPGF